MESVVFVFFHFTMLAVNTNEPTPMSINETPYAFVFTKRLGICEKLQARITALVASSTIDLKALKCDVSSSFSFVSFLVSLVKFKRHCCEAMKALFANNAHANAVAIVG